MNEELAPVRADDVRPEGRERLEPRGHRLAVVEYDPSWASRYETEAADVRTALADVLVALEHVGSTAVPGLAAKPVIDISAGLRTLELPPTRVAAMEALGYEFMGELGIPGRLFFRKGGRERTHHVHAVEWDGRHWHRHRAFRDYLRAHPEEAARYGEHKRRGAVEAAGSEDYWERKQPYVDALFARAWAWYARGR